MGEAQGCPGEQPLPLQAHFCIQVPIPTLGSQTTSCVLLPGDFQGSRLEIGIEGDI